jgi:nucleotide-binding universal stress UspA family protein
MAYKTVLVHADMSGHAPARIRLAAALANMDGGHLLGVASTGMSRFMYPQTVSPLTRTIAVDYAAAVHEQAAQALEQFSDIARAEGVASHEARLVADDPEGALVLMSRFADVLVLSQTDPAQRDAAAVRELAEYVMFNIARPVLMLPHAAHAAMLGGPAVVAWDGGVEAARALAHALPLLRRAASVTVAQFETGEPDELALHASDLKGWLARHGIQAAVAGQHVGIDNGEALLSLASDLGANLLVMGGYGHTRFHELLLGGVTRTVLQSMTVPVLMAH